ncbi:MAG: hypothetical protein JO128_18995 [Alphaproteobacteria bacterium]|nr:hypothetical protein [Alphaproteobacteria bacterium]
MNWIEYVRVLSEFRARFSRMPPSILTEDGALEHIQAALDRAPESGDDPQRRQRRTVVPPRKPDA